MDNARRTLHTQMVPVVHAQSASLVLTTTPPEDLAAGLTSLLSPLRLIGVPAKEIGAHTIAQRQSGQGSGSGVSLMARIVTFQRTATILVGPRGYAIMSRT